MDARLMVKIEPNIDEPQMRSRSNTWPLRPKPVLATASDESQQHANVTIDETPELDFDLEASQQPTVDSPGLDTDNSYCSDLPPDHGVKKAPTRKNAWGNLSYADLITKAIQSAPEKRLTLSQIYEWMVQNVPYFRDKGDSNSSAGWKNSIRHNLSLHNRFMRIQNEGAGKSSWWVMNPDAKPGKTPRRRATSMDTKAYEKKRGRAKKKVEALRAGSIGNGSSLADGCSGSQDPISGSLMDDDGDNFDLSPGGFRSRASSNASSIVMSPMTLRETDMHSSQVPHMSPWGSESNLDYLTTDQEQDSLAANLVDIMKLTASEMSGSYMAELTEGLGCGGYGQSQLLLPPPPSAQPLASAGTAHLQQLQPMAPQAFCGQQQQQTLQSQQQQMPYEQQPSLYYLGGTSPVLGGANMQQQRHYRSSSGGALLNDLLAPDMAEAQSPAPQQQQQQQYSNSSSNGLLSSLLAADSPTTLSPSSPQHQQQYAAPASRSHGLLGGLLSAGGAQSSPPPQSQQQSLYSPSGGGGGSNRLLSDLLAADSGSPPQQQSQSPGSMFDGGGHHEQQLQQRYLGQQGPSPPPQFSQRSGSGSNLPCAGDSAAFVHRTSQMQQRVLPPSTTSSSASSLLRAALQQHQQLSMHRTPSGDHLTLPHSGTIAARHKGLQSRGGESAYSSGPSGVCASLSQLAFSRNHATSPASSLAARSDQSCVASYSGLLSNPDAAPRQQGLPSDLDFNFDSLRAEGIECDVDMVIRQELSIDGSLDFTGIDNYQPCGEAACGGSQNGGGGGGGLVLS